MFKYTSISRLVIAPVLASFFLLVLLNGASILKSFTLLNAFDELENTLVQSERDVNDVLSAFKTQVQEWKNVLLRGHNKADREKYWGRFKQRESDIQTKFRAMLQNEVISNEAKAEIRHSFPSRHLLIALPIR